MINYTAFITGTSFRRKKLFKNWYFKCSCDRCSDPTELGSHLSTVLCPKCDHVSVTGDQVTGVMTQTNPLQEDSPWKCSLHNFEYSRSNIDSMLSDLKDYFF